MDCECLCSILVAIILVQEIVFFLLEPIFYSLLFDNNVSNPFVVPTVEGFVVNFPADTLYWRVFKLLSHSVNLNAILASFSNSGASNMLDTTIRHEL